jgi:hypothetical protein
MKKEISACFMALALVMCLGGIARAYPLNAVVNSMQVVPSNDSTARGSCKINVSYDDFGLFLTPIVFDLNCDFSGLSGGLTNADVRSGRVGQNGGSICTTEKRVTVTLPNNGTGNLWIYCPTEIVTENLAVKDFYLVLQTADFGDGEIRGQIKPAVLDSDVDGEGRAEISVFRPANEVSYAYCSTNSVTVSKQLDWNSQTDSTPFLADFDGDGIADQAFTRTDPGNGILSFLYLSSRTDLWGGGNYGNANLGDTQLFGDYNGDGTIDLAVFRSSNGTWYSPAGYINYGERFGQPGDKACTGDFDGDGKTDLCVIHSTDGHLYWSIRQSSNGYGSTVYWGLDTDTTYPRDLADFNGDGRADIFVSRVENGERTFYVHNSTVLQWGLSTDMVKLGDYDGDGRTDIAAVREINDQLVWFIHQSSDGQMRVAYWGLPGDK